MPAKSQFRKKAPGTRPAAPVRADEIPADWLCTWVYRPPDRDAPGSSGFWELKYVNAACLAHARLPAV
jgi:hypothetical protein